MLEFFDDDISEGDRFELDDRVPEIVVQPDLGDHDATWYELVGKQREPVVRPEWTQRFGRSGRFCRRNGSHMENKSPVGTICPNLSLPLQRRRRFKLMETT